MGGNQKCLITGFKKHFKEVSGIDTQYRSAVRNDVSDFCQFSIK